MKKGGFIFTYCLLLIGQIIICNYFHLTQYVMLSILPAMVMCIPTKYNTTVALCIAFLSGLAVDLFAEGLMGLNILAIVPVAFARKNVVKAIFGGELLSRKDNFSIGKNGLGKVSFALIIAQAIFLLVYILADGAGTRPLWFNAARFGISLVCGFVLSLFIVDFMNPDDRK